MEYKELKKFLEEAFKLNESTALEDNIYVTPVGNGCGKIPLVVADANYDFKIDIPEETKKYISVVYVRMGNDPVDSDCWLSLYNNKDAEIKVIFHGYEAVFGYYILEEDKIPILFNNPDIMKEYDEEYFEDYNYETIYSF